MPVIPPDVRALSAHVLKSATGRQRLAFQRLNDDGWHVRAWTVSDFMDHLLIDGLCNQGDPFRGHIDVNGNLTGEPCDDDELPHWLERLEDLGLLMQGMNPTVHRMTQAEHARQRDRVRASIERDPLGDRPARHQRPAVRTRVSAPVIDDLDALFSL